MELLSEYKDVFAWSYKEMPGLDPKVAVHRLSIKRGIPPKKQPQRRFRPELVPEIEKEVNKLIEAGFIREVKYPTWIANIVPVRKKKDYRFKIGTIGEKKPEDWIVVEGQHEPLIDRMSFDIVQNKLKITRTGLKGIVP